MRVDRCRRRLVVHDLLLVSSRSVDNQRLRLVGVEQVLSSGRCDVLEDGMPPKPRVPAGAGLGLADDVVAVQCAAVRGLMGKGCVELLCLRGVVTIGSVTPIGEGLLKECPPLPVISGGGFFLFGSCGVVAEADDALQSIDGRGRGWPAASTSGWHGCPQCLVAIPPVSRCPSCRRRALSGGIASARTCYYSKSDRSSGGRLQCNRVEQFVGRAGHREDRQMSRRGDALPACQALCWFHGTRV